MHQTITKYTPKDKPDIIQLLRLNTPAYFDPAEEKDLEDYLASEMEHYYVVKQTGIVVAAGGFNPGFENGTATRISWDIVHPGYQGKGIGQALTLFRIEEIKKDKNVRKIIVRTTQLVYKFYEKMGFKLKKIEKDFWAKDFDLYLLERDIREPIKCIL